MPVGTPRVAAWHAGLPSQPAGSLRAIQPAKPAGNGVVVMGMFGGHAFTTLPSESYSTTEGEGCATTVSGETRLPAGPRLTVKRWSLESIQVPATSPVTQGLLAPGPVAR